MPEPADLPRGGTAAARALRGGCSPRFTREQSFDLDGLRDMPRLVAALLALLALAGCDLGGGAPEREAFTTSGTTSAIPVPTLAQPIPTRTELIVQAIRSCEVKRILFLHSDVTWVTFRGGETIRSGKLANEQLERAAWKLAGACHMVIGME